MSIACALLRCVCSFFATCSIDTGLAVVMEYLEMGSLQQLLHGSLSRHFEDG